MTVCKKWCDNRERSSEKGYWRREREGRVCLWEEEKGKEKGA